MSDTHETAPSNFDVERFEALMAEGVQHHNNGQYAQRVNCATMAYDSAPPGSVWSGRAARDIGAGHDRLGHDGEADEWALTALTDHDAAFKTGTTDDDLHDRYRQRAVSEIYVSVRGARRYLAHPDEFREFEDSFNLLYSPVPLADMALSDMRESRRLAATLTGRIIDQYDINIIRRAAIIKGLIGTIEARRHAVRLGLRAVALAPFSEASWLPTAQPDQSLGDRLKAKRKALLGGVASLAVSVLALPPREFTNAVARNLAARAL